MIVFKGKEFKTTEETNLDSELEYEGAIQEARNLNKFLTKKEKEKLYEAFVNDFLDPTDPNKCIYGRITGDCNNEKAGKLIKKCATVMVLDKRYTGDNINRKFRCYNFLTALESYIWNYQEFVYDSCWDWERLKEIINIIVEDI